MTPAQRTLRARIGAYSLHAQGKTTTSAARPARQREWCEASWTVAIGRAAIRMSGVAANMTPRKFSTFGPKMLSGIGELPGTIDDRSIPIYMKRKMAGEKVERFRFREAKESANATQRAVIEALGQRPGATARQVATSTGFSVGQVNGCLRRLLRRGLAVSAPGTLIPSGHRTTTFSLTAHGDIYYRYYGGAPPCSHRNSKYRALGFQMTSGIPCMFLIR